MVLGQWMDDQDRDSRLRSQTARRHGRRDTGFSASAVAQFGRFPAISASRDSRIAKISNIIRELWDCRLIPAYSGLFRRIPAYSGAFPSDLEFTHDSIFPFPAHPIRPIGPSVHLITHKAQIALRGRWKPGHKPCESPSFPVILAKAGRKRESSDLESKWIPAFAGMTD